MLLELAGARPDERGRAMSGKWTVGGVMNTTDAKLLEVFSRRTISRIRMIPAVMAEYLKTEAVDGRVQLSSPDKVAEHGRTLLAGNPDEVFVVYHLTPKNLLIEAVVEGRGTVDQAAVYPRTIIRRALALNSTSLVLLHNHPTGGHEPSPDDIAITKSIADACGLFNIRVLDHIVIGFRGHASLKERGLMPR